jgi:hypothetical protein
MRSGGKNANRWVHFERDSEPGHKSLKHKQIHKYIKYNRHIFHMATWPSGLRRQNQEI